MIVGLIILTGLIGLLLGVGAAAAGTLAAMLLGLLLFYFAVGSGVLVVLATVVGPILISGSTGS
jgi:hypothetical protein